MDNHSVEDPIRAALARNNPAAVEMIWNQYANDLFALLQAVLCSKHDAEDVLQMVFVKMVRKRHRLAKARRLDGYIFQMARNEALNFIKHRQLERTHAAEVKPWLVTSEAGSSESNLAEQLQTALAQLPGPQREVVVLKIYREKTFREIARLLGVSLNTAASRYRYGIERLRTTLKDLA